jgi:hypothetical protein
MRRHRQSAPSACFLVYAREHPEADEPLAAIVATEQEALAFDAAARRRYPGLEVRWESVPWYRTQTVGRSPDVACRLVHVVVTGARNNVIGLAAFDDREAADRAVDEGLARGEDLRRQSLRMSEWLLGATFPLEGR